MPAKERIRNFSIIAHIDHGKSTLADRLMEKTGALTEREQVNQFLDKMDLERERGITIKAQTVRLSYKAKDGITYQLNLLDTPGHVDFQYEVSRSLAACEGALLVVDATQGVEAQTVANTYLAMDHNLEIIPVLNKLDLASADPEMARADIEEVIGLDATDALEISAKDGTGIEALLEAIVERIPPPRGSSDAPLSALIFDSWYDAFRGVMMLVRVHEGRIKLNDAIHLMAANKNYVVQELAIASPHYKKVTELAVGEVGVVIAGIKDISEAKVGDTITHQDRPCAEAQDGFRDVKPVVFAGLFPTESGAYTELREALEKLELNDGSFTYEADTSVALGFGYRCGFLGLLHMEIVQERLEREYNLDLVVTAPSVVYRCNTPDGQVIRIDNPAKMPDVSRNLTIEEPYINVTIHFPPDYMGAVLKLCQEKRGTQKGIRYPTAARVMLDYELPLAEVVYDFHDKLKSVTRGFASYEYEIGEFRVNDLIRLDVLVNGDPLDALAIICHRDQAYYRGRDLCIKLKELIPRQMFEVAIQAAVGTKVIARTTVKALRKNVTAKCYGGDISRKRKLLEKQKAGKKRMKQFGNVEIPQDAFLAVLKLD